MSGDTTEMPLRHATNSSILSDDAVPETDPSSTAGLLAERLQAWKHAVGYLEEYVGAVEKIHKEQAKEYEKVLKTISKPLREGQHFDQTLGGVAGLFENMRSNTQALANTNAETEKSIKGSVLPILDRLHKEIKHKAKELHHGAEKGAKEVEKARNTTQKQIELLGQQTASFESTGGRMTANDDPYVVHRGVLHRLSKQVLEENNHRNDLLAVQNNFQEFEAHVIQVIQQGMQAFNQFAGGQAEKTRVLYSDMLGAAQRIPPDFEWKGFLTRNSDVLINPNDPPRSVESITFPNQNHSATKALIEGSLERKSRNKLSWGYQTGYYVVTPSKFLHEYKDSDNVRHDPKPELSIYLPDAVIGSPNGDKFNIKGKDKAKSISSKLAGTSELSFKAHTAADAERWFQVIRNVAGATGPAADTSAPTSPLQEGDKPLINEPVEQGKVSPAAAASGAGDHKAQEAGITGGETVATPTALSPVDAKDHAALASATAPKS
ncbi:PH domain-containing protein [Pleurostoma richardsiae]|uniref:PH domain-containing protein n=1 Tax=Pleurostoma richardsiae TaxID=41990 RepID=A0AA38RKP4_9PEZI|nr:PH domain-containing protein [Pleurostoma richardsiae]